MTATTDTRRTLVTGGDPYEVIEVPEDVDFQRYIDPETREPIEFDPEDAEEDDELPIAIDTDFLHAPQLETIGQALIDELPEFRLLKFVRIEYRWKRHGGKTNGRAKLGACQKLSGILRDTLEAQNLIWAAADHLRVREFTAWELEALVYHELCHAGEKLRSHDFEGFGAEIVRYGTWRIDLQVADAAIRQSHQLTLFGNGGPR